MGKSQTKKKTRGLRHNPMRVPDSHLGSGKAGAAGKDGSREKAMLPILAKLKAPEPSDRAWACAAVSNLIQNDAATRRLFQGNNVVGELIERLSDSAEEVVMEASGALRNLGIDGGHELCAEMFNKGIMSHLTVLIAKINTALDAMFAPNSVQNGTPSTFENRKQLSIMTENILSLIWSLAEANHKTLAAINAARVEGLLLRSIVGREQFALGVALAAGQALYSLSLDNPTFADSIIADQTALSELVNVVRSDHGDLKKRKGKGKAGKDDEKDGRGLLFRLLVAGALRNLVEPDSPADELVHITSLTNTTILPLIDSLLDLDLTSIVREVMNRVSELPEQDVTVKAGKAAGTDHRAPAEIALEEIERSLTTVSVALEILTGICAGLEDEEMPADIEESTEDDQDESMDEDEDIPPADSESTAVAEPQANGHATLLKANGIGTSVTLPHLITKLNLPARLVKLAQTTPLSFPPSTAQPSPHPPVTSVLSVLHLRALEALNNLLLTSVAAMSSDAQTRAHILGSMGLSATWQAIFNIIDTIGSEPEALGQKGQEMRMEVLEMSMGCLWGLAKIDADEVHVFPQQEQIMLDAVPIMATNLAKTRCLETLASLACRSSVTTDENKAIGTWLLQLLSSDSLSPDLLIAVVNAIIDIYADEGRGYDQAVFVAGGFLETLTSSLGRVRVEVKRIDRRKELRLRALAEEAYDNLAGFVKYRRSLGR